MSFARPSTNARSLIARATLALTLVLMAGAALAGVVPAGNEFRLNTYTAGSQSPNATATSGVALDDAGNLVAVWSSADQDGSLEGIYAQRFAANGTPIGAEFRVNTTTFWRQTSPVVAMGPTGNFVVVWQDLMRDGDSYGIYLQRFDSAGNPLGVETRVNDVTASFQVDASIAMNNSGEYVVTWASNNQDGNLYGVYAKRYNADGTQKGPEFRVNTYTTDTQAIPNLALDDLGRFVITWSSRGQDGWGYGIYFQQYNAAGVKVGVEQRANTFTNGDQIYSTVGLDASGNFAISWTSANQDGSGDGIYARRYDWQGNALGSELLVNTTTAGSQYIGKLAMNDAGAFVVIWRSVDQDGSGEGVYGQLFSANGTPNGGELRVNTATQDWQANESAAYNGTRFVAIWGSNLQDGSSAGVYGQRYLVCDPVVPAPVVSSAASSVCPGASATASVQASYAQYAWSITNGTIQGPVDQPTVAFTAGASGVTQLTVNVTNGAGCPATANKTFTILTPVVPTVSASGPTTFCEGGSVTLTASAGTSYLWSNGATTQAIAVSAAGAYSVAVTDANGCSATSAPTSVTVSSYPAAGIHSNQIYDDGGSGTVVRTGDAIEACGNPTVRLVPLALDGSYTYLWSTGATTAVLDVTTSGTYSVTVTPPNGCAITSSVTVHYGAFPPKPSIAATATELCPAGGSVTLTAPDADGWTWSTGATTKSIVVSEAGSYTVRVRVGACDSPLSDPVVITTGVSTITTNDSLALCGTGSSATLTAVGGTSWLWSNGATTQSIAVTQAGVYSVTTTNAGCTMPESAPVTVTERSVSIGVSGPTSFCEGGSVTLTASSGTSWLWSNGATTQAITVSASGSYSVTATFPDSCAITSAPVAVDSHHVSVSVSADRTTVCPNGPIQLSASATGCVGCTYQWYDNTYAPIAGATSPSLTITPSVSGFVYVKVHDDLGCEASSGGTTYTVLPTPDATITAAASLCEGQSGSASVPDAGPGVTYSWSIVNGTLNFPNSSSVTFTPSGLDPVTLTVTITNAGCSVTNSKGVTILPLPSATISASGPTTFCAGDSVTLTASAGSSYLWSNGATTSSINVTTGGSYSVTVTNANGCSATSSATTVTVNPLPAATINASGPTTFCAGDSVTLTASAGSSYLWSNGATTSSINVTTGGSYSVTITNANGCSATSAATDVVVNAKPATPAITPSGPTTFCAGDSVTLTAPAGFTYLWSTSATTQAINVTTGGSYTVTVSNASGCSTTSAATNVVVNAKPATPVITPSGPTTFCTGGSVTLTAPAGFTYLWSTGATTQAINVTTGGSYTVTVSNASGCSTTSAATDVVVNAKPATPVITPSGPTTFCAGGSVTLTAPAGFTYLWSTGATTQAINVTTGGSFTVTVTNGSGCSTTSAATIVVVNAKPSTPVITPSGPTTFCAGGSVTLTAPAGFTYLWSTGATTRSINATTSGSYSVTVTNASGCSSTSAATSVTVNAATAISQQPQSKTIPKNTSTTISVTATGTGTLTYQWYKGTSPTTTTPISGATAATYTTPVLSKGTYRYWVRVTGSCGFVNSATAVITAN